jgi:TPR repeat protein
MFFNINPSVMNHQATYTTKQALIKLIMIVLSSMTLGCNIKTQDSTESIQDKSLQSNNILIYDTQCLPVAEAITMEKQDVKEILTVYSHMDIAELSNLANNNNKHAQDEIVKRVFHVGLTPQMKENINLLVWHGIEEKFQENEQYIFLLLRVMIENRKKYPLQKDIADTVKSHAKMGEALAQHNLGTMYYYGLGVDRNAFKARKLIEIAANKGFAHSQNTLGNMFFKDKLYTDALEWYKKAGEQRNASAQYNLGRMYYCGQGTEQYYEMALEWYQKAALQGNVNAQYNLGWMYDNGEGIEKDCKKAIEWYKKAAKQGHVDAQYNLGCSYDNGEGVEKNYKKAILWYQTAAQQGSADAQYNLAWMYESGKGTKKDYQKAMQWYKKAAEQGHIDAKKGLGAIYHHGLGVNRDYQKALKWYQNAAQQGSKKRISLKLSPAFKIALLEKLPKGFKLKKAYDNGDCFFDALAQCVNRINHTDVNTVKYLRTLCHEFYQENKVLVDNWNQADYGGIDKDKDEYYMVQYTAEECETYFHGRCPIWGRPWVEGQILCNKLKLQSICITEVLRDPIDESIPIVTYHLVNQKGQTTISIEEAQNLIELENVPVIVTEQRNLHFVPALPLESKESNSKRARSLW